MRQLTIAIQTRLPLTYARLICIAYIRKHAQNGEVSVHCFASGKTRAKSIWFFFFSSRRRHTRWTGDWSLDVCSSDLAWNGFRPPLASAGEWQPGGPPEELLWS